MTKTIYKITILTTTIAAILLTGAIAFPLQPVSSGFFEPLGVVRDNVNVLNIKLEYPQIMVIVDNAGLPGTSDVEMVWRFDPSECMLLVATLPAPVLGLIPVVPDGALGADPAHADAMGVEAVILAAKPGETCEIDSDDGEFVTVSTVFSLGPILNGNS